MNDEIRYETRGPVAWLTLNRPEAANAWTDGMVAGVLEALGEAAADEAVRVVVVTGAGRVFCAGGDLRAMQERTGMFAGDPVELRGRYTRGLQSVTRAFGAFEKPTVAAMNGAAIGAGLDLALMCDLRIASQRAKMGSTFAKVGLIPGDGGAWLLTRTVGLARALELCLTAKVIGAEEAARIGLVHQVVAPEEVLERAREVAEQIAALPPKAVQMTKLALYQTAHQELEGALQLTAALQGLVQHSEDHERAVEAMLAGLAKKDEDQPPS